VLIDWFTVVAQIINFVVLVALLKHFLYAPLIRAIDAREKRIADQLAEAAERNREADQRVQTAVAATAETEQRRAQVLSEAQRAADDKRRELFEIARASVRDIETKWHQDLDREKIAFLNEMRGRASAEILSTARRAVADLASTNVEQAAVDVFLERLKSFDPDKLRLMAGPDFSVHSSAELSKEVRGRIQDVIEKQLGTPVQLRFELAPAMAWGLELRGNGQRIGWTSDTYLDSLQANLKMALDRRTEEAYGISVG
jgi:F-type H+-transporting ATPase subunit b